MCPMCKRHTGQAATFFRISKSDSKMEREKTLTKEQEGW